MDIITRATGYDPDNMFNRAWKLKSKFKFKKRQRDGKEYWVKPADQVTPQELNEINSWVPWSVWQQSWSDKSLPLA